jgi:flagellar motor switch protein FliG
MATSNLHKAAVLMLSLPEGQAAQLLARLEPHQATAVNAEISGLRDIRGTEQQAVVREFAAAANAAVLVHRRPAETAPFEFLDEVDADVLLDALAEEQPQTIALILSYASAPQAAMVLANLPPEQQLSVVCRMATMNETSPEVVRDVEDGLKRRLAGPIDRPVDHRGVTSVIRMLNAMQPAAERKLLGDLAEAAPELVREIRRAMFGVDVPVYGECNVVGAAG